MAAAGENTTGTSSDAEDQPDGSNAFTRPSTQARTNQAVEHDQSGGVFRSNAIRAFGQHANEQGGGNNPDIGSARRPFRQQENEEGGGNHPEPGVARRTFRQQANEQGGGNNPKNGAARIRQPVGQGPEAYVISTISKTLSVKGNLENLPASVAVGSDSSTVNILLEPLDGLAISGKRRSYQKNIAVYGNKILAAERF
ncbi:uncharacterized protein LOC128551186 isoform X1 [Mercenaria mercenaria]|uniref:uncharacterized protein LOC128551186 isoform X1 n=1 Tax=Mercenaria mercenaria TaxID=6596 RepID=UPI00234F3511|nr:uncharacterized protein LOC128551186 isoform X1 [Mercenaria mercenaria]